MAQVPATDTDTLKAALLAKGMLADRGRYSPFNSITAGDATNGAGVVSDPNAVAGNAGGGVSSSAPPPANSNDPTTNPNAAGSTALPIPDATLNATGESDAWKTLLALGIGTTAALAYLYRRRRTLGQPTDDLPAMPGEPIPTVEGENLGPAPRQPSEPINGEYTEATPQIGTTKKLPQGATTPSNQGIKALGAPEQVSLTSQRKKNLSLTSQTSPGNPVASRVNKAKSVATRAAAGQPNDVETVHAADAMTDLTPAEREQAGTLVEQLRARRVKGNTIQNLRRAGKRTATTTLPTGAADRPTILNDVVRMLRMGKLKPGQIARAIP